MAYTAEGRLLDIVVDHWGDGSPSVTIVIEVRPEHWMKDQVPVSVAFRTTKKIAAQLADNPHDGPARGDDIALAFYLSSRNKDGKWWTTPIATAIRPSRDVTNRHPERSAPPPRNQQTSLPASDDDVPF